MKIIPQISVKGGSIVTVENESYVVSDKPVEEIVNDLAKEHETIFVIDMDGLEKGMPNLDGLRQLSDAVDIWIDAGVKAADGTFMDLFVAGADKVVLSSATLKSMEELERAMEMSENVIFNIYMKDGIALGFYDMNMEDIINGAKEAGVKEIMISFLDAKINTALLPGLMDEDLSFLVGGGDAVKLKDVLAEMGIPSITVSWKEITEVLDVA